MLADVQREQQAGHTKLTSVSIWCKGKTHNIFVMARHDAQGRAYIPQEQWIRILDKVRTSNQDLIRVG